MLIDLVKEYTKSVLVRFTSDLSIRGIELQDMLEDAQNKWHKLRIICEKADELIDLVSDIEPRLDEEDEDRRLPLNEMNKFWDAQTLAIRIGIAMKESPDKPGGIFEYWKKELENAKSATN